MIKNYLKFTSAAVVLLLAQACTAPQTKVETTMKMTPPSQAPTVKKEAKELTTHGDVRIDNYYWLNQRENPEVIAYLEQENEYTKASMKPLEGFQNSLFEEMKARIKESDMSVPYRKNGWYYYTRFEQGGEYPLYCRKKGSLEAEEEIMLNVNQMAQGFEFYQVGGLALNSSKNVLAYGLDTVSRRIYSINFKNLETGETLPFVIENTTGSCVWANDNKTIYFTRKDEALRPYQIWKYKLGDDPNSAELVYEEKDETFNCFVYKSKSDKYIIIGSSSTLTSEYRFLDADKPEGEWTIVHPREEGIEYGVGHKGDEFFILTNWNAKNFRLMKTKVSAPQKENWEEVIAHRADVLLEDIELFTDYLVVEERIEGILNLRVIHLPTNQEHYIDFGEKAYTAYASTNMEFDSDVLRISYTSLTTPSLVYDYHMQTKEFKIMKQQEVLGSFNKADYVSERINVTARDGKQVPVSIVHHKNTKKDGKAPMLLYAYGSYGSNIDPYFSSVRLSLLNRGFVYAIAHIRGSETLGREWYEDGKFLNKKNTFFDYIDCGKHLVDANYCAKDQLFAMGGSAGGLLMGAVANYEPQMWKAVVAQVPFVDVVTTMLDESIPLTAGEWEEWGDPREKEYYDYMKSYSPYDNVEAKAYPNMLVTTGLHDSQVQYWEPAKWVAKLRELKTDSNILLLHTEMDFGHSGASGRFEGLKEIAMEYAFILDLAGKAE